MGMTSQINGQTVPVEIAYGICHQIVREYEAGNMEGMRYPAGNTSIGLPWFRDFRQAVEFLDKKPFAGYIQTYVMEPDGSGPSWITAGNYYRKDGRKDGPVSCVQVELNVSDPGWPGLKHLARSVVRVGDSLEAAFDLKTLPRDTCGTWPAAFSSALHVADEWCCPTVLLKVLNK